eukprot:CAMPEP_0114988118 /NCGR_PEP_ID=MMETSP0216-20121206/9408_1 /TAXON_ID=223996 /ORGANISM="Protocruzia adherens, Strain Boccale" /LENGTH=529 /DNA_ID=CAMNT_0002350837 /DNA_START=147 /DNA_END=1736 /DNA_ORIENTATION=-
MISNTKGTRSTGQLYMEPRKSRQKSDPKLTNHSASMMSTATTSYSGRSTPDGGGRLRPLEKRSRINRFISGAREEGSGVSGGGNSSSAALSTSTTVLNTSSREGQKKSRRFNTGSQKNLSVYHIQSSPVKSKLGGSYDVLSPSMTKQDNQTRGLMKEITTTASAAMKKKNIDITENSLKKVNFFIKVPPKCVYNIMSFLLDRYQILRLLSPDVNKMMSNGVDEMTNKMEISFLNNYFSALLFKRSYTTTTTMRLSSGSCTRVDRVITAEIQPELHNCTFKFGYHFKYIGDKRTYLHEFVIDVVKRNHRRVWIHRDENYINGEQYSALAYTQKVPQVCVGDQLEIAVTLYNKVGVIDIETIQWIEPMVTDLGKTQKGQSYLAKLTRLLNIQTDLEQTQEIILDPQQNMLPVYKNTRMCDLELTQTEWYLHEYYDAKPGIIRTPKGLDPHLELIKSEFSSIDLTAGKWTYQAKEPGKVRASLDEVGVEIEILKDKKPARVEVKRVGLLMDRYLPLQLRVGDVLVVYISREG